MRTAHGWRLAAALGRAFERLVLVECGEKDSALPRALERFLSDSPGRGWAGKSSAEHVAEIIAVALVAMIWFLKKNMDNDNLPTYLVRDTFELDLGNEKVDLYNMGQAHTFDDLVVYLKNRKILFTGDLVFNHMNPVLKKESGANVDKWIGALKTIVTKWDINQLVPGHGKIDGKELAYSLIQYFNDMKECAANTDKQKELTIKYKDWFTMPFMASTDKTIDYIKNSN